jgi:prephenate dehydrogenase
MTASEHDASEALIAILHHALVATFAADPATQARSLAAELVATGERPLKPGSLN